MSPTATQAQQLARLAGSEELPEWFMDTIADKVADRLAARALADTKTVGTTALCDRFDLKPDWVRENYEALGGFLQGEAGKGRRPRRRFIPAVVFERLSAMGQGPEHAAKNVDKRRKARAKKASASVPGGVELIPLRDDIAA
jgi:hypothetical protein